MEGKEVRIYLENWQRRMMGDIYGEEAANCDEWVIPEEKGMRLMYGVPIPLPGDGKLAYRLYFTDWQKRLLADAFESGCDFIALDPEEAPMIYRYGVPSR